MSNKYIVKDAITINGLEYKNKEIKIVTTTKSEFNTNNIWMYKNGFNNIMTNMYLKYTLINDKSPPMIGETYICELYDSSGEEQFILHENWIKKI